LAALAAIKGREAMVGSSVPRLPEMIMLVIVVPAWLGVVEDKLKT
jgi:hypothetical protein